MAFNISIERAIRFFLITAIIIVPILSYGEVLALINGTLRSQTESITPIYIKVTKDIVMLLLLLLASAKVLLKKSVNIKSMAAFVILLSIVFLSFSYSAYLSLFVLASGLRWAIPLFLIPVFIYFKVSLGYRLLYRSIFIVYVIHLVFQFYQLFFASHWFGSYFGAFSLRNPGVFLIPGTGSMFTLCCFLCLYDKCQTTISLMALYISTSLSIMLTLSGAGVLILFCLMLIIYYQKYFSNFVSLLLFCFTSIISLPVLFYLSAFLGRGDDYIKISGGDRVEIFYDILERVSFISGYFGVGTNSGVLASSTLGHETNSLTVDSMFSSVLMNTGYLGFFSFIGLFSLVFLRAITTNDKQSLRVSIVILLSSFTSIWAEAYPINLIFAIMLAEVFNGRSVENETMQHHRVYS